MDAFDAHLHIIDPAFPLTANQGFLPAPFTVEDYRDRIGDLPVRITGGAVVSGSFQGTDQTYLLAALRRLGPGYVGVTQLPAGVSDDEIRRLDDGGVRGVRFNVRRGGAWAVDDLLALARRVHDLARWHAELYVDGDDLQRLEPTIRRLPAASVDHLGLVTATTGPQMRSLRRLLEHGVRLKATGFGRVQADVGRLLAEVAKDHPHALMFGTDLPSTRAPRPFEPSHVELIMASMDADDARRVLRDNAAAFYRLDR